MKKLIAALFVVVLLVGGGIVVLRSATSSPTASRGGGTYVALGDSVAAGLGLSTAKTACGRSNLGYPEIAAASLGLTVTHIACSGATMTSGVLAPQSVAGVTTSQLDQLLHMPQPKLITATVGANDLQWTKLLAQCYRSTCGTEADTQAADAKLKTLGENLDQMLTKIQSRYTKNTPKVILTGYYQVLPADKTGCPKIDELTDSEINWWHQQETKLNQTIKQASERYNFASFAPVDFTGHDICKRQNDSWVQTLGSDAPFHPTETGQSVMAGSIVKAATKLGL